MGESACGVWKGCLDIVRDSMQALGFVKGSAENVPNF